MHGIDKARNLQKRKKIAAYHDNSHIHSPQMFQTKVLLRNGHIQTGKIGSKSRLWAKYEPR